MNLYLLERTDVIDYDTYDEAVVCAENEAEARALHPGRYDEKSFSNSWTNDENVKCKYIGEADSYIHKGVVCASFNAG